MHQRSTRREGKLARTFVVVVAVMTGAIVIAGTAYGQADPGGGERPGYTFEDWTLQDGSRLRVNVANGNLLVHKREFARETTRGPDVSWDRYWNSALVNMPWWTEISPFGSLGSGGSAPFSSTTRLVTLPDGHRLLYTGDGAQYPYAQMSDGTWRSPDFHAIMRDEADGSVLVDYPELNERHRFRNGLLVAVEDDVGDRLTLAYSGTTEQWVRRIVDADGNVFSIGDDDSHLAYFTPNSPSNAGGWSYWWCGGGTMCALDMGSGSPALRYEYELFNRLAAIRPISGAATTISYDSAGRVATLSAMGSAPVTFGYGAPTGPCDPVTDSGSYGCRTTWSCNSELLLG
jgi:hypothetical protein